MGGWAYILLAVAWFVCSGLGAYVAVQKGREAAERFVMSLIFGPLGVVAVGLLPNRSTAPARSPAPEPPSPAADAGRKGTCPHCKPRNTIPG